MFIKTTFEASGLRLEEDRLEITCGGELKVVVSIERVKTANKFNCTALGDATPPPEFALDLTGNADPQANPKFVQYLIDTESRLFYGYLRRTTRLLMWRRGITVDYSFTSYREAFWSVDGQQWRPIQTIVGISITHGIPWKKGLVQPEAIADVGKFVESEQDEPLAHGLLREAWSQRFASPRISLVFAIAAAEVGFKQCVSTLVPDASWLVENIQTPPLHKMLTEYLPLLPVKASLAGKALVPPDELLQEIRTGNNLRNEVAHQGHTKITAEKLDRVLRAVIDLLWILEFYQGEPWAVDYVRQDVMIKWKPAAV